MGGEGERERGKPLNTILNLAYIGDIMGRGPGTIYKDCMALAIQRQKELAQTNENDVLKQFYDQYGCCSLLETDVKRIFFKENYSEKTTERALRQWGELDLAFRKTYNGYRLVLFMETLKEGA